MANLSRVKVHYKTEGEYLNIPLNQFEDGWLLVPAKVNTTFTSTFAYGRLNLPIIAYYGEFSDTNDFLTTYKVINTRPIEFEVFVVKFGLSYTYPVNYSGYTFPDSTNYSYSFVCVNTSENDELLLNTTYLDIDLNGVLFTPNLKNRKLSKTISATFVNSGSANKWVQLPLFSSLHSQKIETIPRMSGSTLWVYGEGNLANTSDDMYHGQHYAAFFSPATSTKHYMVIVSTQI